MDSITQLDKINEFLDMIMNEHSLKNDAALSKFLYVGPPVISKLRHGRFGLSSDMIIRIHEVTGYGVSDIKLIIGLPCAFRRL
jgi:plasmid maintenance system antidote protein VapI